MKLKDHKELDLLKIIEQINNERVKQIEKWGQQERNIFEWNCIAVEELGEFVKDVNDTFQGKSDLISARNELIQAVTVQINILDMLNKELDK